MPADLAVPTPIYLGENTALAKHFSDASSRDASASATNARFAEEFSGPSYASVALGEAATTEGQFFRVPVGTTPETYTRYQRTAAGSVEAASLATTADLASTTPARVAHLSAWKAAQTSRNLSPMSRGREMASSPREAVGKRSRRPLTSRRRPPSATMIRSASLPASPT